MADVAKLQAVAAGGLTAGKEYEAAQKGVGDLKQQALTAASQRSDQLLAPEAFRKEQQEMIATPLDAQEKSLGTLQGAGSAYSGATAGAQGNFMSSLNSSKGLMDKKLAQTADSDYRDAYIKLASEKEKKAAKEQADMEKAKKQNDAQNEDFTKSRKEFARQDAAANGELDNATYEVIENVLKSAGDVDTARRMLETYDTEKLKKKYGEDAEPDSNAAWLYILQGIDPDAYAQEIADSTGQKLL